MTRLKNQAVVFIIIFFPLFVSCASAAQAPLSEDQEIFVGSREHSRSASFNEQSENRMITYSITLGLAVKNTEETKNKLLDQVRENDGFIVRETENSITTRIPSENMDEFVLYARKLGDTENESKTGTDITDQYRDNVIRLESLKSVRSRYMILLDQAAAVADILAIERELERVNTEIEILEGRIRYAELSVEYSNITVRFREKAKPGPVGWIFFGLFHAVKWLFVWS